MHQFQWELDVLLREVCWLFPCIQLINSIRPLSGTYVLCSPLYADAAEVRRLSFPLSGAQGLPPLFPQSSQRCVCARVDVPLCTFKDAGVYKQVFYVCESMQSAAAVHTYVNKRSVHGNKKINTNVISHQIIKFAWWQAAGDGKMKHKWASLFQTRPILPWFSDPGVSFFSRPFVRMSFISNWVRME